MGPQKDLVMSESEEMYLVTTAELEEAGEMLPIPVSRLAQKLSVKPVSANQMIHHLEESELMIYQPYKGVKLSEKGSRLAQRILRSRRLWEVFLIDNINIPKDDAQEIACRMEHVIPSEYVEQLAIFLGEPTVTPLGQSIPASDSEAIQYKGTRLSQLEIGGRGQVLQIEADQSSRAFLENEALIEGAIVNVLGIGMEGDLLIEVDSHTVFLAAQIAEKIWVKPLADFDDRTIGRGGAS
jgi:DtxR family Mn-dependent transcriptional regulator